MDHFQYLHVQAVVLGSVMKAASLEDGHDILDFLDVDPIYGTIDDLKALIAALHKRGRYFTNMCCKRSCGVLIKGRSEFEFVLCRFAPSIMK